MAGQCLCLRHFCRRHPTAFRSFLMDVQAPARRKKTRASASRAKQPVRSSNGNGHDGAADADVNMRKLLRGLQAMRDGDFSVRLPSDLTGIAGKVADTFNEIASSSQRMAKELERAGQVV